MVAERGFRGARMSAIAARAGLATGTLYRYFPSRAALLSEVVAEVSQREAAVIGEIARGAGPAAERLAVAVAAFAGRALRGRRLAYAVIAEPVDPEIEAARLAHRRACIGVFAGLLRAGIAEGSFPEQDVEVAAAGIVGALIEGLIGPLAPDAADASGIDGRLVDSIVGFCLRGIGTDATARSRPLPATGARSAVAASGSALPPPRRPSRPARR